MPEAAQAPERTQRHQGLSGFVRSKLHAGFTTRVNCYQKVAGTGNGGSDDGAEKDSSHRLKIHGVYGGMTWKK